MRDSCFNVCKDTMLSWDSGEKITALHASSLIPWSSSTYIIIRLGQLLCKLKMSCVHTTTYTGHTSNTRGVIACEVIILDFCILYIARIIPLPWFWRKVESGWILWTRPAIVCSWLSGKVSEKHNLKSISTVKSLAISLSLACSMQTSVINWSVASDRRCFRDSSIV